MKTTILAALLILAGCIGPVYSQYECATAGGDWVGGVSTSGWTQHWCALADGQGISGKGLTP